MISDPLLLIGLSGMMCILLAFVLDQLDVWHSDYLIYDLVNFLGSAVLMAYAALLNSYPFLILNLVWAGVSLRDAIRDFRRNVRRTETDPIRKWLL